MQTICGNENSYECGEVGYFVEPYETIEDKKRNKEKGKGNKPEINW